MKPPISHSFWNARVKPMPHRFCDIGYVMRHGVLFSMQFFGENTVHVDDTAVALRPPQK